MLIASTRALERPWRIAATMPSRCAAIVRASFTKGFRRQRRAQASHSSGRRIAARGLSR